MRKKATLGKVAPTKAAGMATQTKLAGIAALIKEAGRTTLRSQATGGVTPKKVTGVMKSKMILMKRMRLRKTRVETMSKKFKAVIIAGETLKTI